jgi:hypothetical protein
VRASHEYLELIPSPVRGSAMLRQRGVLRTRPQTVCESAVSREDRRQETGDLAVLVPLSF